MSLLDLPTEIGTLIFTYLDIKSKINVYSVNELKEFFAPCLMRKVNISRSTVASVNTLSSSVLQDFAVNIQDLNLSGIQDLTADKLTPYLQRCTNLKTLDVTFTRIFLSDVEHICCNSLKNISINYFKWPRKHANNDEVWKKVSDIFKRQKFEYVHFVVLEFYDSESPLKFMEDIPMTKYFKITLADNYRDYSETDEYYESVNVEESIDINFERLCYIFRDCRVSHKTSRSLKGVSNLDYKKIEYIFIMYLETIYIYVSPIFSGMFSLCCSDLTINIYSHLPLDFILDGNIIFKAWNKAVTVFNEDFFKNVLNELTDYFPTYFCMHTKLPMNITAAPSHWYCIDSCDTFNEILDDLPENVTLTDFCRKGSVVRWNRLVTLKSELKSLKNITFLSLSNICAKGDFFAHIFSQCKRLYTIDVYIENRGRPSSYSSCTLSLFNSMHLTKCLKNLKLTLEDIEYGMVFDSISQCPSLENVHICEYQRVLADYEADEDNVSLLIEKCCNLYSLFIEADMDPEALTMLMGALRNAAQNLEKDHLCVEVCDCYGGWNPFADVFNPSPLRITE
ncbi:uncharacterized protein LOC134792530 [Cydia splendana]|uniref:uncharacterized protein LOC134792530 n=1 Tax=Cydia splendana TaxID=1100963 RepID=UPI00300C7DCB